MAVRPSTSALTTQSTRPDDISSMTSSRDFSDLIVAFGAKRRATVSLAEWAPILKLYDATRVQWIQTETAASQLMAVYNQPAYRGTVLNLPPDNPGMFYAMVEYHGL